MQIWLGGGWLGCHDAGIGTSTHGIRVMAEPPVLIPVTPPAGWLSQCAYVGWFSAFNFDMQVRTRHVARWQPAAHTFKAFSPHAQWSRFIVTGL